MSQAHSNTTFDWVHPSWRDLVIDHLMRHPDERRRFLRRCSMVGLELALSVSGGAVGQREQPLLRTDEDWLELRRRMLELLPDQDQAGHRLLLEALNASRVATQGGTLQTSVEQTAQELCLAVVAEWDSRGAPLGARALESFYELSLLLPRLPAGPQLKASVEAWLKPLSGGTLVLSKESLAGLAVVGENEPRALRQAGWPDEFVERIDAVVEEARQTLREAQKVRAELADGAFSLDEVDYQSYEAFLSRQMLEDLRRARGDNNNSRTVMDRLASVEFGLGAWSERKLAEEEDRAAELADDMLEHDDNESADPRDFDIEAVLSDL